jgi:hypothetical protein
VCCVDSMKDETAAADRRESQAKGRPMTAKARQDIVDMLTSAGYLTAAKHVRDGQGVKEATAYIVPGPTPVATFRPPRSGAQTVAVMRAVEMLHGGSSW